VYDRAGTIGRGQPLLRFALHIRGVVVHGGKLISPTISDAETILPEIVAPPSPVTENSPPWTVGDVESVNGIETSFAHDAVRSLLS